jgi:two-component system, NarL family, sensor kinase
LLSAVKWYINGFSTRSSIEASVECSELGRLPAELEITLFRLVQESLTNIHRHSGSETAFIRLTRDESSVNLEVIDHGKGFKFGNNAGDSPPMCGVGIRGMKERVRSFGGTIDISSGPTGTRVKVRLPIHSHPT